MLAWQVDQADATATASCSTSGATLTAAISGGTGSDQLVVSVASGSYSITLNGTPTCTGTTYSTTTDTTVTVTGTVSTTFQPGTASGLRFNASGTQNTLDLSGESATFSVAVNGDSSASPGHATASSISDTFTAIQRIEGSTGGTTFDPGSVTGLTLVGANGGSNRLDLSGETSGFTVNAATGQLTSSSITDTFAGISSFVGPPAGGTTFLAPPAGGYSFAGSGLSNKLDLSAASTGVDVLAGSGLVTGLAGATSDTFSGIASFVGSSGGGTTFAAPTFGGLSFTGHGTGNKLDLGATSTGVTVAVVPGTVQLSGGTTDVFSGVQSFDGSSSGHTSFVTGTTGGYTFTGSGPSNTLSFSEVPALGSGVQVSLSAHQAEPGTGTDTFSGVATIVGSPNNDTFIGGSGDYALQGGGGQDTLDDSGGSSGITVSPNGSVSGGGFSGTTTTSGITRFVGSTSGGNTFGAPTAGGYAFVGGTGSGNRLDLSSSSSGVTVAVGSGTVQGLSGATSSDTFSGIAAFVGSTAGGNTFDAPATGGGYTFVGGSGPGNTLDLSAASAGATFAVQAGTVQAGGPTDVFAGITRFVGSTSGGNTFNAPGTGGYTFVAGSGPGNTLDLSAATTGVTVAVGSGSVQGLAGGTTDSFSGLESFMGSSAGGNTFDVPAGGGYSFTGGGNQGNTLDLSATPGATTITAKPSGQLQSLSAGVGGSTTDSFADMQSFTNVASSTVAAVDDAATAGAWSGTERPGASAYDSATVHGVGVVTPSGTVTYNFFSNDACSGSPSSTQQVTLAGDGSVPSSSATGSLAAGSYAVEAVYSGDGTYRGSTGSCIQYTVAGPPNVAVLTPTAGATYTRGHVVVASYACAEGPFGPGLTAGSAGCAGPVPSGSALDTSTAGPHTFTVIATSRDGQTGSRTVTYTVKAGESEVAIGSSTVAVDPHRTFAVVLRCSRGSSRCVGTLTLSVERRGGRAGQSRLETLRIASARFGLAAGHRTSIELKLSNAGRALLRAAPSRRLRATAEAITPANTARATLTLAQARASAK